MLKYGIYKVIPLKVGPNYPLRPERDKLVIMGVPTPNSGPPKKLTDIAFYVL